MRNITTLVLFNFLAIISYGQINTDSLIGSYVYKVDIGGGLMGGPNGECMTRDPDGLIINTIKIDSNLFVYKISDTSNFRGVMQISIDWNCDTLYIGTGQIINDTLIVTYTKKPICPKVFRLINEIYEETEHFQELPFPIIEKYHIRKDYNSPYALTFFNDGDEEYYIKK